MQGNVDPGLQLILQQDQGGEGPNDQHSTTLTGTGLLHVQEGKQTSWKDIGADPVPYPQP